MARQGVGLAHGRRVLGRPLSKSSGTHHCARAATTMLDGWESGATQHAFDPGLTEWALADPRSFLSADPLADAWGLEPGAAVSIVTFRQTLPDSEMLYLDKAWPHLQSLTASSNGEAPRPAHQMFEGHVTMTDGGWEPWVRALHPDQVDVVARELSTITIGEAETRFRELALHRPDPEEDVDYACHYLRRAQEFIGTLAAAGRGLVYMIG
jgi:hypothetical protein